MNFTGRSKKNVILFSVAEMSGGRNVRGRNIRGRNVLAETSVAEMFVAEMSEHRRIRDMYYNSLAEAYDFMEILLIKV